MKLVIAEKNIAAQKIAQLLATGKPKNDKVYNTPVYRFDVEGEEWVSMGLAGHILAPDFPDEILFDKKEGWYSLTEDGEVLNAQVPDVRHQAQAVPCQRHQHQGLEGREPALPYVGAHHQESCGERDHPRSQEPGEESRLRGDRDGLRPRG